jgi:hypothetical protein
MTPISHPAPDPVRILTLDDMEAFARPRMRDDVYAYVSGGAGDEYTLRWNREKFSELRLHARTLVDLTGLDCSTTLLGQRLPCPCSWRRPPARNSPTRKARSPRSESGLTFRVFGVFRG